MSPLSPKDKLFATDEDLEGDNGVPSANIEDEEGGPVGGFGRGGGGRGPDDGEAEDTDEVGLTLLLPTRVPLFLILDCAVLEARLTDLLVLLVYEYSSLALSIHSVKPRPSK